LPPARLSLSCFADACRLPVAHGLHAGINGTQHDADGNPVVDTKKFPDMVCGVHLEQPFLQRVCVRTRARQESGT